MRLTHPLVLGLAAVLIAPVALAAPDVGAPQQAAPAQAAPSDGQGASSRPAAKTKKPVRSRTKRVPPGYGFLPGYEPPPPVDRYGNPVDPGAAWRRAQADYDDVPRYWSRGRWYYGWGGPGFYRGRWNGGSFGPCYTTTPIGMMWTCGR